jgi:hypothetical protein
MASSARRQSPQAERFIDTAGEFLDDRLKDSNVVQIIGVVVFRVPQLILVVDFKLLGGFGLVIYLADGRLIFPVVFVVAIIVFDGWRGCGAFGLNGSH